MTVEEGIRRYATRKKASLSTKTNYEYEKMQEKFADWLHTKKKQNPVPIRQVTRADIADFIDGLMVSDVSA